MKKRKRKIIYLRGHHLLVLYQLLKFGTKSFKSAHSEYGEQFIKNSLMVYRRIIGSKTRIKIIDKPDDICRACKWRQSINCRNAEIVAYDKGGANFFGLKIGKIYSSSTIIKKIKGLK